MLTQGRFILESLPEKTRKITYALGREKQHEAYTVILEQIRHDDPGLDMWRD